MSIWISKYHISQCEVSTNIAMKQNLTFLQFTQLYQEANPKTKQLKHVNNCNLRIIIQYGASFLQLCIAANRILFVSYVIKKKRADHFQPLLIFLTNFLLYSLRSARRISELNFYKPMSAKFSYLWKWADLVKFEELFLFFILMYIVCFRCQCMFQCR